MLATLCATNQTIAFDFPSHSVREGNSVGNSDVVGSSDACGLGSSHSAEADQSTDEMDWTGRESLLTSDRKLNASREGSK